MKSSKTKAYRCATVILSALLVIASLSATGCALRSLIPNQGSDENNTVIQPENTDPSNSPDNGEKEPVEDKPVLPSYYNPLTGLASETDLSMIRPVAISLGDSNSPQYGIGNAEILIEAPVENGGTRTVMITTAYIGMPQIGAIGTTRPYLLALSSDFGAVTVCAGASDIRPGVSYNTYPIMNYEIDGATTVFYKSAEADKPEYLYTSGTRLIGALENFEKSGAHLPYSFGAFGTAIAPIGKKATGVIIPYSGNNVAQFLYDADKHIYLRSTNSKAQMDAITGEQIGFTNLLLLTCESSIYNKVTGTEFDLNTASGGTGYYISEGHSTEIAWSRDADGNLLLHDKNGTPLQVNRGKTYIGMIDLVNSSSVLIVE